MLTRLTTGLALGALVALAGCALVERARMYGAEAAARAVGLECALSITERKTNLDAVNGWLLANGMTARAVALDCDGDGASDF